MIAERETCTACGVPLHEKLPGLETVCPACVVRAAQTPTTIKDGSEGTTWAQVFPQLEIESCLRDDPEAPVYLARVLGDGASERAVLQLASGSVLTRAGGTATLLARSQRLAGSDLEGVAEVLDFGDLADAFFLVTTAPDWPTVPEAVSQRETEEVAALLAVITAEAENSLTVARAAGFGLRFDPETSFVNEERGEVILTPPLIGAAEATLPEEARGLIELAEGTRIGSYELEAKVGEGGFGEVWRARQERPVKREVAIKILKEGLHSQRARARFQVEQQALARLDHPNVARFFEGGTTSDGRPYFAMEWIAGTSLTGYCDEREVSLEERLLLFRALGEAVQFAHQKGIIHRDIKSSNVMVAREGGESSVKVIDFGIARAIEDPLTDGTLLTRAEEVVGTPASMSPEQAAGAGGSDLDARTDVYGLGVLLYELIAGRQPFDPALPPDELRRRIREEDPARPSSHVEEPSRKRQVRGDLDWITMRCLEKDPERRYRSVNALLRDLERHAHDEPVEAGPPELSYRMGKFVRRNRLLVASAAMLVLVLTVASLISWESASRARAAEEESDRSLRDLKVAYNDVDAARSNSRRLLVNTLLEKGTTQFNEGDVTGLISLQEAVLAAEGDEFLQEKALELWTLAHAWLPGSVEEIFDAPYAMAISPDESTIAWCDATQLHFHDVPSGEQTKHPLDARLLELTPDDKGDHMDVIAMTFDSEGRQLAIHNPELGVAQVWDSASRTALTGLLIHPGEVSRGYTYDVGITLLAFSPDGSSLATMARNRTACLWSLPDGRLACPPWALGGNPKGISFSPDGTRLALGHNSGGLPDNVAIYALQDPVRPLATLTTEIRANRLHFLDDGRLWIRGTRYIYRWDPKAGSVDKSPGNFYEALELSPDRQVVATGARNGLAHLRSAKSFDQIGNDLKHGGGGVRSLSFAPDGTVLATGGLDGTVQFWAIGSEPHSRIATWPQFGTIDQMSIGSGPRGFFLSKSRTRDQSQVPAAFLRRFPESKHRIAGELAEGETMMDLSEDGQILLVRSADRMSLQLWRVSGSAPLTMEPWMDGPEVEAPALGITSAAFGKEARSIVLSTRFEERGEYRQWNLETGQSEGIAVNERIGSLPVVSTMLHTSPPLAPIMSLSWHVRLVDFPAGEIVRHIQIDDWPASVLSAEALGWYGVASRAGKVRRFSLDTHQEVLPAIRVNGFLTAAACSHDNRWLLTEERIPERAGNYLRATFMGGGEPFFSIAFNLCDQNWEERLTIVMENPEKMGRLLPLDERSFLYQHGSELRRLDLPEVTLRADQVEAATAAALGLRKDEHGELRILTSGEFRAARAMVRERK